MAAAPKCRIIRIYAFRGDRTPAYWLSLDKKINDEANGLGPGPTRAEVLLYAGHAGISFDGNKTILGFNPDPGKIVVKDLLNRLKAGQAFPGAVLDDLAIFKAARKNPNIRLLTVTLRLSPPSYRRISRKLVLQRKHSKYTYGFPNGDGDCNCATWIERVGIPLTTGRMDELQQVLARSIKIFGLPQRRFGKCQ